jgi:pilus assembly protein CpaF
VTIRDLVTNALRMRPDRIVVGECRGPEALDMLQAMNTGHDGSLTTLHANSPAEVMGRLTMMARFGMDLPLPVIEGQIASAINLIVQVERRQNGSRQVSALAEYTPEGQLRYIASRQADGSYNWQNTPSWLPGKTPTPQLPHKNQAEKPACAPQSKTTSKQPPQPLTPSQQDEEVATWLNSLCLTA